MAGVTLDDVQHTQQMAAVIYGGMNSQPFMVDVGAIERSVQIALEIKAEVNRRMIPEGKVVSDWIAPERGAR